MEMIKCRMKGATALAITLLALVLAMTLGFAPIVSADAPPAPPHQFYGTVKNNGSLVSAGYTVSARVGSTELSSVTTDSQGRYGYDPVFYVSASDGATIEFYVNGVKASQTASFSSGAIAELNLTVTGAPQSSPPR